MAMINDWPGIYASPVSTNNVCVPPDIVKNDVDVVLYLSPPVPVLPVNPVRYQKKL